MRPLKDRVLIKIEKTPEKIGSLFIPQNVSCIPICTGVVQEVGEGEWLLEACRYELPAVKIGERVMFSQFAGQYLDDEKLFCTVRECDIYCVVEGEGDLIANSKVACQVRDIQHFA